MVIKAPPFATALSLALSWDRSDGSHDPRLKGLACTRQHRYPAQPQHSPCLALRKPRWIFTFSGLDLRPTPAYSYPQSLGLNFIGGHKKYLPRVQLLQGRAWGCTQGEELTVIKESILFSALVEGCQKYRRPYCKGRRGAGG